MLTKRQNMLEVIRGGNPDRFVKQYEGLTFVLNTPYQTKYPMMPEGPGAPTVNADGDIIIPGLQEHRERFRSMIRSIWYVRTSQSGKNM